MRKQMSLDFLFWRKGDMGKDNGFENIQDAWKVAIKGLKRRLMVANYCLVS